jgi:hypothetical protein
MNLPFGNAYRSYYESSYPAGTESDPAAPWNQEEPDPLQCDTCDCDAEDGAVEGGPCTNTFRWDDGTGDNPPELVTCEGHYRSTRCTECNSLACRCDQ